MRKNSKNQREPLSLWAKKSRLLRQVLLSFVLLLGVGCARRIVALLPAPEADKVARVAGEEQSALAEVAGVRMVVRGNAWTERLLALEEHLTPVHVTIENQSGRPLRIRYNEFALVSSSGVRYSLLPPYQIRGRAEATPVIRPAFPSTGFHIAPYYGADFPGLTPWDGSFDFDPSYYERYYRLWRIPLPVEGVLEKAIPEGVLEDRGSLSGFCTFRRLGRR